MTDVAPELLERLQEAFERKYENDDRVGALFYLTNGFDTASEAMNDYAAVVGDILAETFAEELSSEDLPDGRMYWNIAERVVNPMLQNNYELITQACEQAITTLNEHAGIGIKPIIPAMDQDRIRGIDNMLANAERYDDVAPRFREAVVNYSQSVATDAVRENADFQYRAGMEPKIIREAEAGACEWCQEVAGTYNYRDVRDTGNDVYRRHENCRCRVMYEPRRGSGRQNVHSKRWVSDETPQERETRISDEARRSAEARKQETELQLRIDEMMHPSSGERRDEFVRLSLLSPPSNNELMDRATAGASQINNQGIIARHILNGDFSLRYSQQKYQDHEYGTVRYQNTSLDRGRPQSVLYVPMEVARGLVYQYAGTGTLRGLENGQDNREFLDVGFPVGVYYNNGEAIETQRICIQYSSHGVHIYPVREIS